MARERDVQIALEGTSIKRDGRLYYVVRDGEPNSLTLPLWTVMKEGPLR